MTAPTDNDPADLGNPSDDAIDQLLRSTRTIAVVGASDRPDRASYRVMRDLIQRGYDVYPVNPTVAEIQGRTSYPDLASLPVVPDLVDVFRRSELTDEVADAAIAVGASALWLQLGVVNGPAAARARAAGLTVVQDRCVSIELARA